MARASWAVPPCCANAAAESARADTVPMMSVRNIGILLCLVWDATRGFARGLPDSQIGTIRTAIQNRALVMAHLYRGNGLDGTSGVGATCRWGDGSSLPD